MKWYLQTCIPALILTLMCGICTSNAHAQQTGNIPDASTETGNIPQGPTQGPTQTSNFTPGELNFNDLLNFDIAPEEVVFENERLQPFVGRSLARFQDMEIQAHPRSQFETPNSSGGGGGGGQQGFNFRGAQNQRGLQGGQGNSFEVARQSIRTRVIPGFDVRNRATGQQVSTRFQERLSRLPLTSASAEGVKVRVEGVTAILTGNVANLAERSRVERMARLEPGIYKIENRIEVRQ